MAEYKQILNNYKALPGGLLEAYHAVQGEYNYLPGEAVREAAAVFGVSASQAFGTATFYSYLKIGKRGRYIIRICESAPCHIAGAAEIITVLEKELGIKMGETTADGKFTLEFTECVGQCQATPVITINSVPYTDIKPAQVPEMLAQCR
ncbi:NADH-quinone oxidoreductase subunit E [Sporotomaculum syntrophicum]|uniref:NADH-quinone oxidoreductase subunit E n=1 Tax=Sporotomaculum syntrophicum TaxID=182264 RepID=A0A9D2WLT4_9FIRM|nr:NAD(P)H-dependent oxidoreductase subunit E [Sporotomaculum syntrophicum]KAF1083807.1 NADH-quinone oxidoreductase subunit E [Sporotomaculum syntrophicum]